MELTASENRDELVERCKKGDRLGYKELYGRYCKAMYNTCLRILNDATEAEDILQESFIEAFRNLQKFEYRTSFGGWLKQICINRCINQLKKRKLGLVDIGDADLGIPVEEMPDEEKINLKVATVKKAMQQLPDGYRTVLSLYLFEGYDQEEIAGILQVAESTVRTQYSRGKQKLIQLLNSEYEQARPIY